MSSSLKQIDEFLALKRFAMVGVSHHDNDFSRTLFRELVNRGYEVVPVNPKAQEIDGKPCYARLQDIPEPPAGALLMTAPAVTQFVVRDASAAGIAKIWMYKGGTQGAVSKEAVTFCQDAGMSVIPGECPYMFLSGGAWFHRLHGAIRKLTGSYPH